MKYATAICLQRRSRCFRQLRQPARSALARSLPGEFGQRIAAHAANAPIIKNVRTDRTIKFNRWLVPFKHRPFEAGEAILHAMTCELPHQGLADPFPAQSRPHEDVFQIKPVAAPKRREIEKPQGKTYGLIVPFGDVTEQPWLLTK